MGKIPAIIDGLATLRDKKITICLILQSLAQLDSIYGADERKVIADTCAYKAILSATDAGTQEYFSLLVGTYEKPQTSVNVNQNYQVKFLPQGGSSGTSTQLVDKRIIKPEKFATLTDVALLTPHGFGRVAKMPYYDESTNAANAHSGGGSANSGMVGAAEKSPKNRTAAGILALLLGRYGVHNFYLRRSAKGAAQLIITVLGIVFGDSTAAMIIFGGTMTVWSLVDAIMIFRGKYTDGGGRTV